MLKPECLELPLSPQILRAIIEAFGLGEYEGQLKKQNRRLRAYLDGERSSEQTIHRADVAIASALIKAELFPPNIKLADVAPPGALQKLPPAGSVANLIANHANLWDALARQLREHGAPVAFPQLAIGAVLRVIAVDLAVRLAAVHWLSRHELGEPPSLHWLSPDGIPQWLRERVRSLGLTQKELATRVGVSSTTIEKWLKGARPQRANLEKLARVIAKRGGRWNETRRELQIAYACRKLFELLVPSVGALHLADAVCNSVIYAGQMLKLVCASRQSQEVNDDKMKSSLIVGANISAAPWSEYMLRVVYRNEVDPVWRTTLRAVAEGDVVRHLQRIFQKLGAPAEWELRELEEMWGREASSEDLEQLAYIAQATKEEQDQAPLVAFGSKNLRAAGGRDAAIDLKIRALETADRDHEATIELLRAASAETPLDAEIHYRLGCQLWQSGKPEEGLTELRIAKKLSPAWDRPRVEIAIVLGNEGRHDEALEKLHQAETCVVPTTPWLILHVAFSLEQLGRVEDAISEYRHHNEMRPNHGEALDRLAHLLFVSGDKRGGARLAKEAAVLGVGTVMHAWERGHYGGEGSYSRPPHSFGLGTHFGPRITELLAVD